METPRRQDVRRDCRPDPAAGRHDQKLAGKNVQDPANRLGRHGQGYQPMNAMTCEQVQEQLDLLAAGECDPPARAEIEQHLRTCPACAATYAESQRLMATLDRHWSEAGIERIRQRIETEKRPVRR